MLEHYCECYYDLSGLILLFINKDHKKGFSCVNLYSSRNFFLQINTEEESNKVVFLHMEVLRAHRDVGRGSLKKRRLSCRRVGG